MRKQKLVYILTLIIIIFLLVGCSEPTVPTKQETKKIYVNVYDEVYENSGYTFTINKSENIEYFIKLHNKLNNQEKKEERTIIEIKYYLDDDSTVDFKYRISEDFYYSELYSLFNINEVKKQIVKLFNIDINDITKISFQSHKKDSIVKQFNKKLAEDIYAYLNKYYTENDYFRKKQASILASVNFFGSDEQYLTFAYIYDDAFFIEELMMKYPYLYNLYISENDIDSIKIINNTNNDEKVYTDAQTIAELIEGEIPEIGGDEYSIYVKFKNNEEYSLFAKCNKLPNFMESNE